MPAWFALLASAPSAVLLLRLDQLLGTAQSSLRIIETAYGPFFEVRVGIVVSGFVQSPLGY